MTSTVVISIAAMVCAVWLFLAICVGMAAWKDRNFEGGGAVFTAAVITVIAIVVIS